MSHVNNDKNISPVEMGNIFAEWNSEQQADFFNAVALHVKYKYSKSFCFQCSYIATDDNLTKMGADIMRDLGESVNART